MFHPGNTDSHYLGGVLNHELPLSSGPPRVVFFCKSVPANRKCPPHDPTNNPWAGFWDGNAGATNNGDETSASWSYTYFKWHAGNATGSNGRLYLDQETYSNSPLERTSAWYPASGFRQWNTGPLAEVSNQGVLHTGRFTSNLGMRMGFNSTGVTPEYLSTSTYHLTVALSVRCLSK